MISFKISCGFVVAIVLVISARIPYGVSLRTSVTIRMTTAYSASIILRNVSACSGFLRSSPSTATPIKAEKITTARVEVLRAPVISANGFFGMKSRICCGIVLPATSPSRSSSVSPRAISRSPAGISSACRSKLSVVTILTDAAIAVVISSTAIMSPLIFPRFCLPFNFIIAEIIDTIMSGMTTICNKPT
ncbi:hypothetical protein D3C77_378230 [compost metagenome]